MASCCNCILMYIHTHAFGCVPPSACPVTLVECSVCHCLVTAVLGGCICSGLYTGLCVCCVVLDCTVGVTVRGSAFGALVAKGVRDGTCHWLDVSTQARPSSAMTHSTEQTHRRTDK